MSTPSDRERSRVQQATLFGMPEDTSRQPQAANPGSIGPPRLRTANRHRIVFHAAPLDALLPQDQPARIIWDYVEGPDLSPLYARIKAVEGRPGRAPIGPKILLALWLFATVEGIGSARRLDQLCREHDAFRWIAGDVSTNYHTLADFRTEHVELLDNLLAASVAVLMAEGLVDLNRVAQDGMRVRASAGAASFRRRAALEEAYEQARAQVETLRGELETDPGVDARRRQAAQQRAARGRVERVKAALERLPELGAKEKPGEKDQARASTTDAEATVMKMADGGFRPAYNVQYATDTATQMIAGVAVETTGSDAGQVEPMANRVEQRYATVPPEWLVDGGFAGHDRIEAMSPPERDCTVYAPVPKPKDPQVDRYQPKPTDSASVASWRQRMATDRAKAIYKERAATAECVNALARGRGLVQLTVRGRLKARAVALWYAPVHNVLRAAALRAAVLSAAVARPA